MVNQKKIDVVASLSSRLVASSSSVLLGLSDKITHTSLESLRKEVGKFGGKLTFIKNTLLKKGCVRAAAQRPNLRDLARNEDNFKNSVILLEPGENWNETLKVVLKVTGKDKMLNFKDGVIDGVAYDALSVAKIANLPPKAELVAKVIGSMKNPVTSTVYALKYNLQKLVFVLSEKSKQA